MAEAIATPGGPRYPCTHDGCTRRSAHDDGLCGYHRGFLKQYGHLPAPAPTEQDRILGRIDKRGDGCWMWTGAADRNGTGYGCCRYQGRNQPAHRAVYQLLVGPIPAGLQLDHLCGVRLCVRPDHLEPVTRLVNTQRAVLRATDERCANGHLWADGNLRIRESDGARECRACAREKTARYRERARAAG